jgi:hypothetical protein
MIDLCVMVCQSSCLYLSLCREMCVSVCMCKFQWSHGCVVASYIALPISSAWMSNIFAASASLDICLVGVLYRCIFTVSIHCLSA